jgi:phage baseplate assembly protein gpV
LKFALERIARQNDLNETLQNAMDNHQTNIWTALPGRISSYNPTNNTCTVLPMVQCSVTNIDGTQSWVSMPLLLDVPVSFPQGGGFALTFPVNNGDECLLIFSSRSIDNWYAQGFQATNNNSHDALPQSNKNMHSLNDAFAIVGVNSLVNPIPSINTTSVQLRAKATANNITIDPSGNVTVNATNNITATAGNFATVTASRAATVTAPNISLKGNVTVTGNLTVGGATTMVGAASASNGMTINGSNYSTHHHVYDDAGTQNTTQGPSN